MRKKLELAMKVFLVASFFVPLVVAPNTFIFPFIVPKILLLRTLAVLMLAGYVSLLVIDTKRYKPRLDGVMIAVLAFFLSFGISTFVGVDWYRSFYDNHERMLGLLTIIHYGFIYLVATAMFRSWSEWKQIFRWFLGAGALVMLVGVAQKFNPELLLNRGSNRVSATLGNAIYYSGYGFFLFMIGVLLFVQDKAAEKHWKFYYAGGALLGFLGIFFGGTRGTLLGLIAAVFVSLFLYAVSLKEHKKMRKTLGGVLIGLVVLGIILRIFSQTAFVQSIPTVGRLASINLSSGTADTRLMAWATGFDAWKEMPVFGWGPNNFYYAFNKYYRAEMLRHGWGETWFDNAHNVFVNTLAVQGIVGVVSYLAMFGVAIYALWRAYKRNQISVHIFVISSAFLIGHLVHNVFVFENPASYLYFFTFMAFLAAITQTEKAPATNEKEPSVGLVITFFIIALLLVSAINLVPKRANNASLQIIRRINSPEVVQNPDAILEAYDETLALGSPHIDDIRNDISRSLNDIIPQLQQAAQQNNDEVYLQISKKLLTKAYEEQVKNIELHPLDIRVQLQLAQILQQRAFLEQNVEHIITAEKIMRSAIEKSPKRQQLAFSLAPLLIQQGKNDEAIAVVRQAVDDDNQIIESWWRYLSILVDTGNMDKAVEGLVEARSLGLDFNAAGGNGQAIAERIDAVSNIDVTVE